MLRFYCSPENISKDKIEIRDKKEINHIVNVLRLKEGDEVIVFDGEENEYFTIIEEVSQINVVLKIKEKRGVFKKDDLEITLACAIPKRKRFDLIIEKTTELGVKEIIPLKTERTEVFLNKERMKNKLSHWQRIAISSAKQSKRIDIPKIESQTEFNQILERRNDFDFSLICAVSPKEKRIKEVLKDSNPKSILVLIGPEGDFTSQEIDSAIKEGFIPVSLGDLVLRVETAAIAVISFIRLYYENS